MRVACFQSDVAGLSPEARLARLETALHSDPVDLVVTPELFLTGYNIGAEVAARAETRDGPGLRAAAALARATGTWLVIGYAERAGDRVYNAAAVIGPDGTGRANHRKRLPSPGSFEERAFAPGTDDTVVDLGPIRLGVLICYEVELPEAVRRTALAGAELIAVPTALSAEWGDVAARMVPTRAFENGVWIAYANHAGAENGLAYLGGSRIAGPDWAEDAVAEGGPAWIAADIDRARLTAARARLPYLRDGPRLAAGAPG